MNLGSSVVHVNVIGFMAAVSAAKDSSLRDRAFVIGREGAARSLVLDSSRRAVEEGVRPGMPLSESLRRFPGLLVVPPNPAIYGEANALMERLSARYAPVVQNDSGGHLYLDLGGTRSLFGPYIDTAVRIKNEITEALTFEPAVVLASNRLVAKVGTRSIRPAGLAAVREGEEAAFLGPQDVCLLPGVGPKILRILLAVGFHEIGELAAVDDGESLALFGPFGRSLTEAARGIDDTSVAPGGLAERSIVRKREFEADVLDGFAVRGALISLAESAGLELRRFSLSTSRIFLSVSYTDGAISRASETAPIPCVHDRELIASFDRLIGKAHVRRVRVRGLELELRGLAPASAQLDLFSPDGRSRIELIQNAVDRSRMRFGAGAVTRGSALVGIHV